MEPWYSKLCEKIARENKSPFQASNELDLGLTKGECDDLLRNKDFAACLRGEKLRFYRELAADPQRSKVSTIGQMLFLADELTKNGFFDKAARILLDVSKLEGWLDSNTQVNIFGDLSGKDIQAMRDKLKKAAVDAVN